jgi:hypothetical protein
MRVESIHLTDNLGIGKGFKREKGDAALTGDPLVTFKRNIQVR